MHRQGHAPANVPPASPALARLREAKWYYAR